MNRPEAQGVLDRRVVHLVHRDDEVLHAEGLGQHLEGHGAHLERGELRTPDSTAINGDVPMTSGEHRSAITEAKGPRY